MGKKSSEVCAVLSIFEGRAQGERKTGKRPGYFMTKEFRPGENEGGARGSGLGYPRVWGLPNDAARSVRNKKRSSGSLQVQQTPRFENEWIPGRRNWQKRMILMFLWKTLWIKCGIRSEKFRARSEKFRATELKKCQNPS
jgi:hypothetical protein